MRIVLQRVARARVLVEGEEVGAVERGAVLLLGVERGDGEADAAALARKVAALRFFPGRTPMDQTLAEVGGACLVVSQFTLLATLAKGNRPGFEAAEEPARARPLVERFAAELGALGLVVRTGRFGLPMSVELVNDGPVTFVLEARDGKVRG
jgi:D-tyrosyl-tRNA(Tyr) deacylase